MDATNHYAIFKNVVARKLYQLSISDYECLSGVSGGHRKVEIWETHCACKVELKACSQTFLYSVIHPLKRQGVSVSVSTNTQPYLFMSFLLHARIPHRPLYLIYVVGFLCLHLVLSASLLAPWEGRHQANGHHQAKWVG